MDNSRAQRLRHIMNTEGWNDLLAMLNEQISEPRKNLEAIMAQRPEELTQAKAVSMASAANALEAFKESILEAHRISPQPERAGVR